LKNGGMTMVRRESLAEKGAELLIARIRDGEREIGGKLPGETTLAPQRGVGRSTARKAIRILTGRGILATRQGSGVFVTATDVSESWDAVLKHADIVAIIEARTAIEVEAAALAAERRTSADLTALRAALDERKRHRSDIGEHVQTDMAFHRGIIVAAQSPVKSSGCFEDPGCSATHGEQGRRAIRGLSTASWLPLETTQHDREQAAGALSRHRLVPSEDDIEQSTDQRVRGRVDVGFGCHVACLLRGAHASDERVVLGTGEP
jgi:DNA-binding GntR family transcriptional regulator